MKIKKIIDICKKNGAINLYENGATQWISDGYAVYPMFNLPKFDESSLCKTYDITEKQAEKIRFSYERELPAEFSFEDIDAAEAEIERGPMFLSDGGHGLIPYMTSEGVAFTDAKYFQPLSDIPENVIFVCERRTKSGRMYFAIKSGFMLVGIVVPVDVVNEQFVDRLEQLTQQCKIALYNKRSALNREGETDTQRNFFESEDESE